MYQQITLVGNLGGDPQMRYTPAGKAVANFGVATSRSWTDADGQRQERTVWFRVAAWERLAETCNQYLTKGQRVLVVGELEEPHVYTDQGGNARAALQVRARTVQFLSTRAEGEALNGSGGQAQGQGQPQASYAPEEDIPF